MREFAPVALDRRSQDAGRVNTSACSLMDRALGFEPSGCGFNSRQARQFFSGDLGPDRAMLGRTAVDRKNEMMTGD